MDIVIHMVRIKPEERLTAEKCLERGYRNGLFVAKDDPSENGTTTPTQQSVLGTDVGAKVALHASTILDGEVRELDGDNRDGFAGSPIEPGPSTPTRGPASGPPTRRRSTGGDSRTTSLPGEL